jgi:hypothetical protein
MGGGTADDVAQLARRRVAMASRGVLITRISDVQG